ncbi:MAG: VWA domain-containing protein [Symploca sp. SIO2D2]|nr:VWA domain-containing protein [Symploca sp. SIO2D2]
MQVSYSVSQAPIAVNQATSLDIVLSFKGEPPKQAKSRVPLNLSLVLDRSGSMGGQPLRYAIQAARKLVEYLTPEDFLSVVIYDDEPETIVPSQPVVDRASIQKQIGKIRAGGLTNLSGGWLMGCERVLEQQSAERVNRVLLLTDGQANLGTTKPNVLRKTAQDWAEKGIITTTLGFGRSFNEDLLIGMANAAGGNFYYIQTPEEAEDVFAIELQSLVSVVAQNLTVTLQPEASVEIPRILNNYNSQKQGNNLEVFLGDVYQIEPKPLALELALPAFANLGEQKLVTVTYKYQTVVAEKITQFSDQVPITITVGSPEEANEAAPDVKVQEQTSKLRIAQLKDEAIALADQGNYQTAAENLLQAIAALKQKALDRFFEVAEEIENLDYYAQRIANGQFDTVVRKEMRDQSHQAQARDRKDLQLRGIASGSTDSLEAVNSEEGGVLVKCVREKGKLRVRVISEGYNQDFNVQFPRRLREEGATYLVEEVTLSADGNFYRVAGDIKLYLLPGQQRKRTAQSASSSSPTRQAAKAVGSAADLETTTTVGDGVLVQCVKDGKKLRARVVSDGYNPNYNIRFPRNIREEGMLFVVDEVKEAKQGGSYIAYGKIRRLV